MKFVIRLALPTLLLGVPAATPAQVRDEPAPALNGTWKFKSVMVGGKKEDPPADLLDKVRLVFNDKTLTIKGGPDGDEETTIEVDNTKKPAHLTIQQPKGEKRELKAIYKIEGDTLTIC